jgi:hypothetical protein
MPRFVLLQHDHPRLHWDLMLEAGEVLRTWRLSAPPEPGQRIAAEATFDHRRMYLDYEGPVSGNRGTVTRWDSGEFAWVHEALESLVMELNGQRLRGPASLSRDPDGKWWFLAGLADAQSTV